MGKGEVIQNFLRPNYDTFLGRHGVSGSVGVSPYPPTTYNPFTFKDLRRPILVSS